MVWEIGEWHLRKKLNVYGFDVFVIICIFSYASALKQKWNKQKTALAYWYLII